MSSEKASVTFEKPRAPRQKRGRERVAALMTSGAQVFVEKGFVAATMTEVAARAGASIGALYLFFPTKAALAQAIVTEHAEELSRRLDALRETSPGLPADRIADLLFATLGEFMASHPAYSALIDLPGDESWRHSIRIRRRQQIAALFAQAKPALSAERTERLAVIVPQLMRIPLAVAGENSLRSGVLDELRLMLTRHLGNPAPGR